MSDVIWAYVGKISVVVFCVYIFIRGCSIVYTLRDDWESIKNRVGSYCEEGAYGHRILAIEQKIEKLRKRAKK